MTMQTETHLNQSLDFAPYFRRQDNEADLPMHFQAVNGYGCRIEQHGSSVMLKWDDCVPGKQVGCLSIAKPICVEGAEKLLLGLDVPAGATLSAAWCLDGHWNMSVRTNGDQIEIPIPEDVMTLDQIAICITSKAAGPQSIGFSWVRLCSAAVTV